MYDIYRLPRLLSKDHTNRVRLCAGLQPRLQLLSDILLMDQARLTQDGITNARNSHSWTEKNPRQITHATFNNDFQYVMWTITQ